MYKRILTVVAALISLSTTSFAGFGSFNTKAIETATASVVPECNQKKESGLVGSTNPKQTARVVRNTPTSNGTKTR